MKKIFKVGIALLLVIITCSFILVSCGDKAGEKESSTRTTVTQTEWISAFEKPYKTFNAHVTEKLEESVNGEKSIYTSDLTYNRKGNSVSCRGTGNIDGEIQYINDTLESEYVATLEWYYTIWSFAFDDDFEFLVEILEELEDYGYNSFEYSEETAAYSIGIPYILGVYIDITIWFENGYISKIALHSSRSANDDLQVYDAIIEFSNITY